MTREAYRRSSSFRIRALAVAGGPITLRQKPAISARISLFPAVSGQQRAKTVPLHLPSPLRKTGRLDYRAFTGRRLSMEKGGSAPQTLP